MSAYTNAYNASRLIYQLIPEGDTYLISVRQENERINKLLMDRLIWTAEHVFLINVNIHKMFKP